MQGGKLANINAGRLLVPRMSAPVSAPAADILRLAPTIWQFSGAATLFLEPNSNPPGSHYESAK